MHVLYTGLIISGLFAIGCAWKIRPPKGKPEAFADEHTIKTMTANTPDWNIHS